MNAQGVSERERWKQGRMEEEREDVPLPSSRLHRFPPQRIPASPAEEARSSPHVCSGGPGTLSACSSERSRSWRGKGEGFLRSRWKGRKREQWARWGGILLLRGEGSQAIVREWKKEIERTYADSRNARLDSYRYRTPGLSRVPPSVPVNQQHLRYDHAGRGAELVEEGDIVVGFTEREEGVDVRCRGKGNSAGEGVEGLRERVISSGFGV